jgi:exosortase/archaeosortase family protein
MLSIVLSRSPRRTAGILAAPLGALLLTAPYLEGASTSAAALAALAVISALLVLPKEKTGAPGHWWGILLPLAACAYLFSQTTGPDKLVQVSGVLLLGWSAAQLQPLSAKQLLPAMLCLLFAIPMPYVLETTLGLYLAGLEATGFVAVAQAHGLPVYQFGAQIVSGETAATINSNCSGTMLIWPALLGGIVAARQMKAAPYKKLMVVALCIPLALGLNVVRLGILLALNFQAPEEIASAFHDMLGWFLIPLVWMLPLLIWGRTPQSSLWLPKLSRGEAVLLGAAIVVTGATLLTAPAQRAEEASVTLPFYIKGWTGETVSIPGEEARILAADWAERRRYVAPYGNREMLMTFMQHRDADKAMAHSSKICFEAMGWQAEPLQSLTVRPGVEIRHLLVRSFNQVQAVTEIVFDGSDKAFPVSTRLQFVEAPTIPVTERHATAMAFVEAFGLPVGGDT